MSSGVQDCIRFDALGIYRRHCDVHAQASSTAAAAHATSTCTLGPGGTTTPCGAWGTLCWTLH